MPVATGEVLWSDNYVISVQPIKEQGLVVGKITAKVADPLQGVMHTHWSRTYLANLDTVPDHHKALVYFRNFTDHLNRESFEIAVNTFLEALERNPNDIVASVLFASACRRDYAANYDVIESPLEKGLRTIERVIRLNPNSHEAHYVHGLILFCMKEWDLCKDAFDKVRSISRYHIVTEFGIGFTLCKMNKWEKGLALAQKAMLLSADYPSFYHIVPFLDFYRQEKYEQALSQAKKITTPATIHGPLARCISYGQLGDIESAEMEFQEILYRYPKFLDQGRDLLTHIFGSETLVDNIWRGVLLVNSNCK